MILLGKKGIWCQQIQVDFRFQMRPSDFIVRNEHEDRLEIRMRLTGLLYLLVIEPVFLKGMSVSTSVFFLESSSVVRIIHKTNQ